MSLLRHLPNALTLGNLFLGMAGVVSMANFQVENAIYCMIGSLILDVLDGALARKLGVAGPLGIQLDSLADMVSFGVLPGMMVWYMGIEFAGDHISEPVSIALAGILAVSTGLRLGRFNIDTRPREFFWGLATPAGAIIIASWLWAQIHERDFGISVGRMPILIILVPLILSVLYQAALKLPGLKSNGAALYLLIILAILILVGAFLWGPIIVFLGFAAYVLAGLLNLVIRFY